MSEELYKSSLPQVEKRDMGQDTSSSPSGGLKEVRTPAANLQVCNIEEARRFLAALAPNDTEFTFQTFDDRKDGEKKRSLSRVIHGKLDDVFPILTDLSAKGAGVYVTINKTDLEGRATENIVGVRALFADMDGVPLSNVDRFGLEPLIQVETSPDRYHLHWPVEGVPLEEFKDLQKRLVAILDSDPKPTDLPRVMRLPGFNHQKSTPFPVTIIATTDRSPYSHDEILKALRDAEKGLHKNVVPSAQTRPPASKGAARFAVPWTPDLEARVVRALAVIPPDDYGDWLMGGMALHSTGWGERAFTAWDNWSRGSEKYKPGVTKLKWKSFSEDPEDKAKSNLITLGSLFHAARTRSNGGVNLDEETTDTFKRLSDLPLYEYDRRRLTEAELLGIRVSTLDAEVAKHRTKPEEVAGPGRPFSMTPPDPWDTSVDGAQLLDDMINQVLRYVMMPIESAIAIALWCLYAHVFEGFPISPRLAITSPEKRCGKTTLLNVIQTLVPKPLQAAHITAAAIFRTVEAVRPTLLIDEADTFIKDNEELRGIINSGHSRGGQVVRLVGDNYEPHAFSTWCPTAIAAIGSLPDTIEDRSIPVSLKRRRPEEKVERFRSDKTPELVEMCRKAARWGVDNHLALIDSDPSMPAELHDRAADNWRPLLAIADQVGGGWGERARHAAVALSVTNSAEGENLSYRLLSDIREIFVEKKIDRIGSEDLAMELSIISGSPWITLNRGKAVDSGWIAKRLRPFEIRPGTVRMSAEKTAKGYRLDQFKDAFERYLPLLDVTP
jgi:hypothetical protein